MLRKLEKADAIFPRRRDAAEEYSPLGEDGEQDQLAIHRSRCAGQAQETLPEP